jgi:hypothetical protein
MKGIVLIFIIIHSNLFGQDFAYMVRNAIKIDRPDSLDGKLYDSISRYRLIMVGEFHGTKEPATFVGGLIDLLIRNGDTVQVGMEIPADQMQDFYFFHKTPRSNRATEAWSRLIERFRDLPKVNFLL